MAVASVISVPPRAATTPRADTVFALTDGATVTIDAALGNICTITLGGNRTFAAPTSPTNGQVMCVLVKQDGIGSRTITWNAVFRFSADLPSPTLTTTAGLKDKMIFQYDGADSKWDFLSIVKGF